jgi:hypothetical protein
MRLTFLIELMLDALTLAASDLRLGLERSMGLLGCIIRFLLDGWVLLILIISTECQELWEIEL